MRFFLLLALVFPICSNADGHFWNGVFTAKIIRHHIHNKAQVVATLDMTPLRYNREMCTISGVSNELPCRTLYDGAHLEVDRKAFGQLLATDFDWSKPSYQEEFEKAYAAVNGHRPITLIRLLFDDQTFILSPEKLPSTDHDTYYELR